MQISSLILFLNLLAIGWNLLLDFRLAGVGRGGIVTKSKGPFLPAREQATRTSNSAVLDYYSRNAADKKQEQTHARRPDSD